MRALGDGRPAKSFTTAICLACGRRLGIDLEAVAAVRCQDCRDSNAPLRADLFELQLAGRREKAPA